MNSLTCVSAFSGGLEGLVSKFETQEQPLGDGVLFLANAPSLDGSFLSEEEAI